MSNPNPIAKITNFVAKNVVLSSIIAVLAVAMLGTLAAQAFAPDNLKPFKVAKSESSSSSSSSSVSSSSVSSSSVSSLSSTSSIVSSITNTSSATNTPKTQTYTNQYFPDFKIVYDDSWKLQTSTTQSNYNNLVNRGIFLQKNDIKVEINLYAKSLPQCGGGGTEEVKTEKLASGVNKIYYRGTDGNGDVFVTYGDLIRCIAGTLNTNLNAIQYPDYKGAAGNQNDKVVVYTYSVGLANNSNTNYFQLKENDPLVKEIDQIISQSTFK